MAEFTLPDGQSLSDFMAGGAQLEASVLEASMGVRAAAKQGYKQEWLDARLLLLSTMAKLLHVKAGVPGASNEARSHRILLLIAFVQGTNATEVLISEGQYIKATAVLKQDYEILIRVREVKAGAAKAGQTPQVKHAPEGSQRFYGELNKVAHPSNPELIARLLNVRENGDAVGPTYIPTYSEATSNSLYELHVWLLLEMTREALILFMELYGGVDPWIHSAFLEFMVAAEQLQKAGFVITS